MNGTVHMRIETSCFCSPPRTLVADSESGGKARCEDCGAEVLVGFNVSTEPRLKVIEGGAA